MRDAANAFGGAWTSLTTTRQPLTFDARAIIVRTNYGTSGRFVGNRIGEHVRRLDLELRQTSEKIKARLRITTADLERFERLERSSKIPSVLSRPKGPYRRAGTAGTVGTGGVEMLLGSLNGWNKYIPAPR